MEIPDIPFRILALAPFAPQQEDSGIGEILPVDKDSLSGIINRLSPSFQITVPKEITPAGMFEVMVRDLKGFRPDTLITNTPFLANLTSAKAFMAEAPAQGLSPEQMKTKLREWSDLPEISVPSEKAPSKAPSGGGKNTGVADILKLVALPDEPQAGVIATTTSTQQIEDVLRKALLHIFSDETFRRNEGIWLGVKRLLDQGRDGGAFQVDLLPVAEQALDDILENLASRLIEEPPSLIVVDFPFDSTPVAIERLRKIAELAETVLAPAVCAVGPGFFHLDDWHQLDSLPYVPHYLDNQAFAKWRNLADGFSGRWLTVTCNRYGARYPYGQGIQARTIKFHEPQFLFSSPVWAIASLVAQSVDKTGWPCSFSKWQNIHLEDLPVVQSGGAHPTEVWLNDERIAQFIEAGISPLIGPKNKDIAFAPGDTTISGDPLSYQLFISRLSHFILWCKDHFEEELSPQAIEERLRKAFSLFWERTGHPEPEGLNIHVGKVDNQGRMPVRITLSPARQILATAQPVELEFLW